MTIASRLKLAARRDLWLLLAPAVLIAVGAIALGLLFVKPAPPDTIVIAAGHDEGGYSYYVKRYQKLLARYGVTLQERDSAGSVDNLKMLIDQDSDVEVAFVQGGTGAGLDTSSLVSLGALYREPLWVFYRGDRVDDLAGLKGKRIAIGAPESGTNVLAKQLLDAVKVSEAPTELLTYDREQAVEALVASDIDAMMLVSPPGAPLVKKLAASEGVHLLSFARADAFARRFPFLERVVLPHGVLDLANDVPETDVVLLAPTANLVACDSLHPALAYLLMRVAAEVHGKAGLLDAPGEFPAARESGFELAPEAKRFYKSGPPLLQRYLPYWAANLADRLWIMLVPLLAVLLPLLRLIPPVYRWRVRSRIYRWYGRLKELELELQERPGREGLESILRRLEELDRAMHGIPTPLSHAEALYGFRSHIELVRAHAAAALVALDDRGSATADLKRGA